MGVLDHLHPELQERFAAGGGELAQKMGIEYVELGAERSIARMPVEGNRQVVGILHGGAHVVLGESLGSLSAAIHAGPGVHGVIPWANHLCSRNRDDQRCGGTTLHRANHQPASRPVTIRVAR